MQCPNCAQAELVPVVVYRVHLDGSVADLPLFKGDYCPACELLQPPD